MKPVDQTIALSISLSGHQASDPLARVKHTRLHGVLWDAGDLGDLIDRLLVVVD
jgi:hypothetical protein